MDGHDNELRLLGNGHLNVNGCLGQVQDDLANSTYNLNGHGQLSELAISMGLRHLGVPLQRFWTLLLFLVNYDINGAVGVFG